MKDYLAKKLGKLGCVCLLFLSGIFSSASYAIEIVAECYVWKGLMFCMVCADDQHCEMVIVPVEGGDPSA